MKVIRDGRWRSCVIRRTHKDGTFKVKTMWNSIGPSYLLFIVYLHFSNLHDRYSYSMMIFDILRLHVQYAWKEL